MFGHLSMVLPAPCQPEPLGCLQHQVSTSANVLKGQMVNILGFTGHTVSVTAT